MGDFDLATASAVRTAQAIRDQVVSPTEATQAAIARVERLNPQLNAFVYTAFDEALERAAQADTAVTSGAELGPLHGVPTAIKDLFDFKPGWPATFGGIPALKDYVVPASCIWAERMEEAGAVILGKTNSPVMGFRGTPIIRCSARRATRRHGPQSGRLLGRGSGRSGQWRASVRRGDRRWRVGADTGGVVRGSGVQTIVGTDPGGDASERLRRHRPVHLRECPESHC